MIAIADVPAALAGDWRTRYAPEMAGRFVGTGCTPDVAQSPSPGCPPVRRVVHSGAAA